MQLAKVQKLGGISIIIGSIFLLVYSILFPLLLPIDDIQRNPVAVFSDVNFVWISVIAFVAVLLLIFGFIAVYSKISGRSGLLGLLGFIMIELAYIFQLCVISWEIFIWPLIAGNQSSLFLIRDLVIMRDAGIAAFEIICSATILIGIILFCISLFRSKVFPKLAAILIFIGALLYGIGAMLPVLVAICGVLILSIGCSLLGMKLIRQ